MDGIEKFFFLLASNDLELIVSGDVCMCVCARVFLKHLLFRIGRFCF